jgi:hypothetical protein
MCDIDYLVVKGLNKKNCYWGKGLENEPRTSFLWCIDGVWLEKYNVIEKGWWEDFLYYEQNNHAILVLCGYNDPRHPIKRHSILIIEFVTQAFGAFILAHMILGYCENKNPEAPSNCGYPPFYATLFLVTLPVVLMRNWLHFLYRCPCVLSRHEMTAARKIGFGFVRWTGYTIGFVFLVFGIAMGSIALNIMRHAGTSTVLTWFSSVAESYIFCVVLDLAFKFNPFNWALALRRLIGERTMRFLATFSVGQWLSERELARSTEKNYMHSLLRDELGSPASPVATGGGGLAQRSFSAGADVDLELCVNPNQSAGQPSPSANDPRGPIAVDRPIHPL